MGGGGGGGGGLCDYRGQECLLTYVASRALCTKLIASTPGPTELGSRPLILHGWSLGNTIAQKHHYDNAHKQIPVCWRSQELLLSMTSSCQQVLQMLGFLHGDDTDSAR